MSSETATDDTWIVIPVFNEGGRLQATLDALLARPRNIVVVDDGSTDESADVAARLPVWLVRHGINCGQGASLQTGIDFALSRGAKFVVTFDADGQHRPEDIDAVLAPLVEGRADVCLGSRFLGKAIGLPPARRALLKAAVLVTRIMSRLAVTDTHNGLRALTREAAEQIRITQDRMAHASEILDQIHQWRLRWCEVPVTIRYTAETLAKGQSGWNAARIMGQLLFSRIVR